MERAFLYHCNHGNIYIYFPLQQILQKANDRLRQECDWLDVNFSTFRIVHVSFISVFALEQI